MSKGGIKRCVSFNLELEGAAGSTSYNINQIKLMPFVELICIYSCTVSWALFMFNLIRKSFTALVFLCEFERQRNPINRVCTYWCVQQNIIIVEM
jgi:hypothetical protein